MAFWLFKSEPGTWSWEDQKASSKGNSMPSLSESIPKARGYSSLYLKYCQSLKILEYHS